MNAHHTHISSSRISPQKPIYMKHASNPKISIIIPMYNEEDNISILFGRLFPVLENLEESWEVVCINDGSRDGTLDILLSEAENRKGLVIVNLARNFGQHAAVMAGFFQARGEWIVTMDADLQNPPEEIPKIVGEFQKGHDLIGTVRQRRQDTFFRKFASMMTNKIVARISGISLKDFGCMLRGYGQEVVKGILENPEYRTFIPALATFFAKNPVEIEVKHGERAAGQSKYSLLKLLSLQLDLMTGFSMWPLRILFFVGTLVAILGLMAAAVIVVLRLYYGAGWAAEGVFTLFAALFFLVGCQFFALGLIGEYVGRIFQAVRKRPSFIIGQVFPG